MEGDGYPMVASHDPTMIDAALGLATLTERTAADFEFQMLFGIRDGEQRRLVAEGNHLRVYVPYGSQWYGLLHASPGGKTGQPHVLHALTRFQQLDTGKTGGSGGNSRFSRKVPPT